MINDKLNSIFADKFWMLGIGEHKDKTFSSIEIKEDGTKISSLTFDDDTTINLSTMEFDKGEVFYCRVKALTITAGLAFGWI